MSNWSKIVKAAKKTGSATKRANKRQLGGLAGAAPSVAADISKTITLDQARRMGWEGRIPKVITEKDIKKKKSKFTPKKNKR